MKWLKIFSRPPRPNFGDCEGFESIWQKNQNGSAPRLGTYKEMEKTLTELKTHDWFTRNIGYVYSHSRESEIQDAITRHRERRAWSKDYPVLTDHDDLVGDPKHVFWIIPPCHALGYSIEEGSDNYTLEVFERVSKELQVIKRYEKIVAAIEVFVSREEHYGNIHYV